MIQREWKGTRGDLLNARGIFQNILQGGGGHKRSIDHLKIQITIQEDTAGRIRRAGGRQREFQKYTCGSVESVTGNSAMHICMMKSYKAEKRSTGGM